VVCVGDLMVDVLARLPGPLAVGSDTPAEIEVLGGGSAANAAAWLALVGVTTTFVGCVGDDELGRHAVAQLRAAGVETAVSIDPTRPTGTCIVLVDTEGERTMVPAAGANSGLGDVRLPAELFTRAHLHLSAYSLFDEAARPGAQAALRQAREAGASVSVDAASAAPLARLGAERFFSWLNLSAPGHDILLLANLDEALVLCGSTDTGPSATTPTSTRASTLALELARRCGEAVVKCGAQGAVWSDGEKVVQVGTTPVLAVDTTGAGDAFAAGLLAARLSDTDADAEADASAALAAGNRLAARAITQVGARPRR
jgi:sugar/nucleoside kinase (ribokinase family)